MPSLPAAADVVRLLHLARGRDGGRWGGVARVGVDDRNGVAAALGQRLVQLEVGRVALVVGIGGHLRLRQREGRRRLQLMLQWGRLGRAAAGRGADESVAAKTTHVVLGQKVPGAEHLVVVEVEAASGLKVLADGGSLKGLGVVPDDPRLLELLVWVLLLAEALAASRAAAMVAVPLMRVEVVLRHGAVGKVVEL
ncbi:hypothetical protein FH972_022418 [Carpinus fangiana]|uniref:Uncharacterized protein n=1 Tax=Carpinus fangiana TaxID=176857 RepID=A0A5N6KSJ1_9ROSI|nr:hypothetical protein FH972_022418 [Carpinus fangiana]